MAAPLRGDQSSRNLVLIPARLASRRLPRKPLLEIGGVPMIVRVWQQAVRADVGPVIVAAADEEIADIVQAYGGQAVLTDPELASGTDRIRAALHACDAHEHARNIVNLQGDLPMVDPTVLSAVLRPLETDTFGMATLVAATEDPIERLSQHVVKAVVSWRSPTQGKALYFTRAPAPFGGGPVFHHIGIYAFRRETLEQFAALPPSPLELRERLEQLRAIENDITIGVELVDAVPPSVDTPEDLASLRAHWERHQEVDPN